MTPEPPPRLMKLREAYEKMHAERDALRDALREARWRMALCSGTCAGPPNTSVAYFAKIDALLEEKQA